MRRNQKPHDRWDRARLNRADLRDANLREASLVDADLSYANIQEADFEDACLIGTNFGGVDLRDTIGLTQDQINLAVIN